MPGTSDTPERLKYSAKAQSGRERRRRRGGRRGRGSRYGRCGRRRRLRLQSSPVGHEKSCSGHRRYRYLGWAGNHYFFDKLRWNGWSLVDESSCQDIVRLTIRRHCHYTALSAPFLGEIADRQELRIRDVE